MVKIEKSPIIVMVFHWCVRAKTNGLNPVPGFQLIFKGAQFTIPEAVKWQGDIYHSVLLKAKRLTDKKVHLFYNDKGSYDKRLSDNKLKYNQAPPQGDHARVLSAEFAL